MKPLRITLFIILLSLQIAAGEEVPVYEFQHLTNLEAAHFPERIKFMTGDTLEGWVHSNGQIAIMQSPIFYGLVTTCAPSFWHGIAYNPIFMGPPPVFNYPRFHFTEQFTRFRQQATVYSAPEYNFAVVFRGSQGYDIVRWPLTSGAVYNPRNPQNTVQRRGRPHNQALFFESDLYVTGTRMGIDYGVAGTVTIGCSGNMWLMDNIRYVESDPVTGMIYGPTPTSLGLLSESNILIMNTWANGRCNGRYRTNSNPDSSDIIINGALYALNGCFSFQDQNDDPNNPGAYPPDLPEWYFSAPPGGGIYPYNQTRDERGTIHLWGSVAQSRRGYVHRSNFSGTGYFKDFNYYSHILNNPPPFYPKVSTGLTFSDTLLNFGNIPVHSIAPLELNIINESYDSIYIYDYDIIDSLHFITDFQDTGYFYNGETITGFVYFTPYATGWGWALLYVRTDMGDFSIRMEGRGVSNIDENMISARGDKGSITFRDASPNPFNSSVTLKFTAPSPGKARFEVFNTAGRRVYASVVDYYTGLNYVAWVPLKEPSGVYFYRLKCGESACKGKVVYLR